MTQFQYQATDSEGKRTSGSVDAVSIDEARMRIIEMGLTPVELVQAATDMPPPSVPPPKEEVSFKTEEPIATSIPEPVEDKKQPNAAVYFPLLETLRLYAGWLLAWYALVYAVGSYQFLKELPVRIPYAESLFLSPLVLSFTFAAYLFLLATSIYKAFGNKKIIAFGLLLVSVGIFLLYRMNVQ